MNEKKLSDEIGEEELEEFERLKTPFVLNQSNELFDDEEASKKYLVIRVRRVALPYQGENWEISEDGRKVLTIRGIKLTNREKSVLRTPEGINLIICEYKSGIRSITKIKSVLRNFWKKNND